MLSPKSRTTTSESDYVCRTCDKIFILKCNLARHATSHLGEKNFTCIVCEKSFARKSNLDRHINTHKDRNVSISCPDCGEIFTRRDNMLAHLASHLRNFPFTQCNMTLSNKHHLNHQIKASQTH